MSETDIVQAIIKSVKDAGGDAWHVHGSSVQRMGEPDLTGEVNLHGKKWYHFKIEVKLPGEQPSLLQQFRLDRYAERGYVTGCAHSVEEFWQIITDKRNRYRAT